MGIFFLMTALPACHLVRNGGGVDVAHQAADILLLARDGAVGCDALRFLDCIQQRFGKIELGQPGPAQPDQLFAQVLQLLHGGLDLGFA
ncbi:hypothetical protein GALL_360560 [mine drainage metagenome]|uniref:Uncharacterized protein n=1 Tax=mine drainage metagenome TaxID=410659 RepID=A0A1J5QFZ8_9ZZZZ